MAAQSANLLHVEFFSEARPDEARSRDEGRPVFETKEFVRIKFPGDKNRVHVAYANEPSLRDPETNNWLTYKDRFPAHYEAFKKNERFIGEGTPIDEAPFLNKAQKEEMKATNIFTVEALANLPDGSLKSLGMNARQWKSQAQAYIERAAGSAVDGKLAAENAALKERLAAMERQMSEMQAAKAPADDFDTWSEADLRAFIKDATGKTPSGNASDATLVRMAREAHQAAA